MAKINKPAALILLATAAALLVVAALAFGVFNFIADDGTVGKNAIESLVAYWVLFCLLVLLVAAIRSKPLEVALAAVSLLAALGLTEAAVRIVSFDWAKRPFEGVRSRTLHHIYPPNVEMFMGVIDGQSVVARTNEDGLRTDYSREEFLKFKHRVVLMGDSFVLGLAVGQDATCDRVVEQKLRAQLGQKDIGVLNAGVVSYSPLLEERLFRNVIAAYKPTVVMLLLDVSDIGDDVGYEKEIDSSRVELPFDLVEKKRDKVYSAIYQVARPFLVYVWDTLAYPYYALVHSHTFNYDYYDFDLTVGGTVEKNRYFIFRHPLEVTRPFFEKTLGHINEIAKEVRSAGGYFVLVVTPRHQQWSDRECPGNWEMRKYEYSLHDPYKYEYFRFFREAENEVNFDIYQPLPAFQHTEEFPLVFDNDPHWNKKGHAFVGGLLADYLIKFNIIR